MACVSSCIANNDCFRQRHVITQPLLQVFIVLTEYRHVEPELRDLPALFVSSTILVESVISVLLTKVIIIEIAKWDAVSSSFGRTSS